MMDDKLTLDVRFHVNKVHAAALMAMFEYWTFLGVIGSSRTVSFYVDGDGDFHPNCQIMTSRHVRVDDEMRSAAVVKEDDGNRSYDYDPIYGLLRQRKEEYEKRMAESDSCDDCEEASPTEEDHE